MLASKLFAYKVKVPSIELMKHWIRKIKLILSKSLLKDAYSLLKHLKKNDAYLCNSATKDAPTFVWHGTQDIHSSYFLEHALGKDYSKMHFGHVSVNAVINQLVRKGLQADVYLQPTVMRFHRTSLNSLIVPYWAEFDVNLEGKDFENKYAAFQKIRYYTRKAGFTPCWPEMTQALIDEFYYEMVVPFISARKGDKAMKFSREYFASIAAKNGKFLFLERDGKRVAGMVILMGEVPMYHTIGIRMDDAKDHFADGAFKSLFYFAHIQLQKMGYLRVTVGGSRPFLNDHSLVFKIQIGCEPIKNRILRDEIVLLSILHDSPQVRNWLNANPFISLDVERQPHPTFFVPFSAYCDQNAFQKLQATASLYKPAVSLVFVFDCPDQFKFEVFPSINFFPFKDLVN